MTVRAWHWIRVALGLDDIGWPVIDSRHVAQAPPPRDFAANLDALVRDELVADYERILDGQIGDYLNIPVVTSDLVPPGEAFVFGHPDIPPLARFQTDLEIDTSTIGTFQPPKWLIDEYIDLSVRKMAGVMMISRELIDPQSRRPRRRTARERRRIWRRRYIWRPIAKRRVQLAWWLGGQPLQADASDRYGDY